MSRIKIAPTRKIKANHYIFWLAFLIENLRLHPSNHKF